jgi:hypothetical protein
MKKVQRPNPNLTGCKVSRDNQPGALFVHDSGRTFRIEDTFQAEYSGNPTLVDKLNDGTVVTITLGSGNTPSKITVTYLIERKGWEDLYREGVTVFSQWKFSTGFLVHEKEDNPSSKLAASVIATKCPAIRKVSAQDNKGLWTALGLASLEHISLHVGEDNFSYFWGLLGQSGLPQDDPIFGYLQQLWQARVTGHAGDTIDTWFDNQSFQEELVRVVKHLTLSYVKTHPNHEDLSFFEGGVTGFETDVKFAKEVSEPMIGFAALALPIKLAVYSLDPDQLRKGYGGDSSHPKLARINLLRQYEVFYILYSQAFLEVEGYTLEKGRSNPKFTAGAFECLYYTPKNDKIQLKGSASAEEYQQAVSSFSHKAQLIGSIESSIACIFNVLKTKPLPGNVKFFNSQLLNATYLLRANYRKSLAKLESLPDDVKPVAVPLYNLGQSGVLDDLSVMQMCDKCQTEVGEAQLTCGHYICKGCFARHIAEVKAQKGYVIDPAGEAVEDLICPILGCTHFEKITGKTLQILMGEQLEVYQHEAESVVGTRKCKRCTKVYTHDYFVQFSICGCRLCAFCEAEMLRSGNPVCLCGNYFSQYSTEIVYNMNQTCVQCNQTRNLMTGFTSVRCSEHTFCVKCLSGIMKQAEPRCPQDHRRFAQYEIDDAKKMLKRTCGLLCGRELDSSEVLALDCDCHYCEKCAVYVVKQRIGTMQSIYQCFVCQKPFPKVLLDRYTELVKNADFLSYTLKVTIGRLGNYKATICPICTTYIGKDQNVTLTCNHAFHKECIKEQAEAHTNAVVKTEVLCASCRAPIDGNILQNLMDPATFHKYNVKLIEAKMKMVYCPNCKSAHSADAAMLLQEAPVKCQICSFQFCALCGEQWGLTHNTKRCKFDELKRQIAELEADVGPNDMISQCPTCKTPFLKDDQCDHMKCAYGCPDWCFLCSAIRPPILQHGNHWHRPDCKFVGTEDISGYPMLQACPECVKLGRRCDPPPQLKVPRRFDFDEY